MFAHPLTLFWSHLEASSCHIVILFVNQRFLSFFTIWQLEASRCDQNDVRGCANIFHYRRLHSENFIFLTIFGQPPPQVGQGPSGPRVQVGEGLSGPRAQVGQGPSRPRPKWTRAQVGPGLKWGQGPSGPGPKSVLPVFHPCVSPNSWACFEPWACCD